MVDTVKMMLHTPIQSWIHDFTLYLKLLKEGAAIRLFIYLLFIIYFNKGGASWTRAP